MISRLRRLWPLAALPLLAACASALLPYGLFADDDIPAKLLKRMARHDRNRDGLIDATEFPSSAPIDFHTADGDGDGRLTLAEVVRLWLMEQLVRQRLGSDELYDEFAKADLDQNGLISRVEYLRSDDVFDDLDANGDQLLGFKEVLAKSVNHEVQDTIMANDLNSDGNVSRAELPKTRRAYILAMDTNGDQLIDKTEASQFLFVAGCEAHRRRSLTESTSIKPALTDE